MNQIGMFNETGVELTEEEKMIQKLVKEVLKEEKVRNAECNIIFVDNEKIHEINREYRHIDRVTDVISFALEDEMENEPSAQYEMRVLGDIYISVDQAKEQALEYGHSFLREICFLAIHGMLHLLGYDHQTTEDEKIMFQKQEEVLAKYGIVR